MIARKRSALRLRLGCSGLLAWALASGAALGAQPPPVQKPFGETPPAETLTVLNLSGTVLLGRNGDAERALRKGDALSPGDRVMVRKASTLLLKNGYRYYMLHSYSTVRIDGAPVLVYGQIQSVSAPPSSTPVFENVRFSLSPRPAQGKTVKVLLRTGEAVKSISASISDGREYTAPLRFFPVGDGGYRALSGFDVEARTGRYILSVRVEGANGDLTEIRHPFTLAASVFERGKVYLPDNTRELLEPSELKNEERETLLRLLSVVNDKAFWSFAFRPPVDRTEVLSAFGRVRLYHMNGISTFNRPHRGVDLRGERGEYVIAPNSGFIVFSGIRITTGNTIVIDHGQGVFTLFFHLDALYGEAGAYVVKGQRIGEIGATGITEGAHLHWGMFVNGVYVDPMDWLKRAF